MNDRFYISTIAEDAGAIAAEYGLGLEIADFCTAENMDSCFENTMMQLNPKLNGISLRTLHGPFNELFPCAIDPKARALAAERFLQAASLAQDLGAAKLILHGGYNPYIYFPIWYHSESVKFWQSLMPQFPEDLTICLENVMEEDPQMLANIIRQVNHPRLKMCLDIGHANAYSRIPCTRWLSQCSDVISHFHIHNNDGSRDAHAPLEEGSIPMAHFLHCAMEACPDATFALELMHSRESAEYLKALAFL